MRIWVWIPIAHPKPSAVVHVCNPSTPMVTWEVETRESVGAHRPASLEILSQTRWKDKDWHLRLFLDCHMHSLTLKHLCLFTHTHTHHISDTNRFKMKKVERDRGRHSLLTSSLHIHTHVYTASTHKKKKRKIKYTFPSAKYLALNYYIYIIFTWLFMTSFLCSLILYYVTDYKGHGSFFISYNKQLLTPFAFLVCSRY